MSGTGKFISFEGGEGCGKTTQLKLLAETLTESGIAVVQTREPGGTEEAEAIRALLLSGHTDKWDATEELMLFSAARHNHLRRLIVPAISQGSWVLSDRFLDSTTAYQGYARGYDMQKIALFRQMATNGTEPDMTLVFDIDPQLGLARAMARRGTEVRFEGLQLDFHNRVRQGLLDIAGKEPERCWVIDATGSIDDVRARVWQVVRERFTL
jgi:dTMP kinase